jgi:hypothetical protein
MQRDAQADARMHVRARAHLDHDIARSVKLDRALTMRQTKKNTLPHLSKTQTCPAHTNQPKPAAEIANVGSQACSGAARGGAGLGRAAVPAS